LFELKNFIEESVSGPTNSLILKFKKKKMCLKGYWKWFTRN